VTIELGGGVRGLLGPNGSGKSTLLKLATGQLRPTSGTIEVFGQSPWNHPRLFRRVGFCPEQDAFYAFMTGFEFVSTLARLAGLDARTAAERARAALERVGASDFMDRKIATYSKGMRQRTKVAQAIVHDPDLLILDEPLTGTDPIGRRELMDLIDELGREGKSILLASHVLHEIQAVTTDFLLIHGGRVLASGDVGEIRHLMNEYPHRIHLTCDRPRELAHRILKDLPVRGVELGREHGTLTVQTEDPGRFFEELGGAVEASGATIRDMRSEDDNLETVFRYLVRGR
jgi:ABC-2 type transport system ATP-binding protein